jgi:intergrase/recombinase
LASVSRTEPKISVSGKAPEEERIVGEAALDSLNNTYKHHRGAFHKWLEARVAGSKLEAGTARDYKAGVKSLFHEHEIKKPSDCDAIDFGDKQSRGLRNFLNYLEDEEILNIAGYSLATWRRKVQIKQSGRDRTFPTTKEMIEAWKHLKDNEVTIFKLLAYSGCRFSHG